MIPGLRLDLQQQQFHLPLSPFCLSISIICSLEEETLLSPDLHVSAVLPTIHYGKVREMGRSKVKAQMMLQDMGQHQVETKCINTQTGSQFINFIRHSMVVEDSLPSPAFLWRPQRGGVAIDLPDKTRHLRMEPRAPRSAMCFLPYPPQIHNLTDKWGESDGPARKAI